MAVPLSRVLSCEFRNSNIVCLQFRGFKRWLSPTLKYLKTKKEKSDPPPPIHRSALIEWNYKGELFAFSKRLGEDFDSGILQQAFTTREYVISENEKQKAVGIEQPDIDLNDNRAMVELGDKVINSYVLRYLRTVFPRLPEEGIYAVKQFLTSEDHLAMIASNIGINDLILTSDYSPDQLTSANTFKAVVAGLVESSGIDRGNLFVRDFILTQLVGKNIGDLWKVNNPVELLADIFKRDCKPPVEYRIIGEAGRNTVLATYRIGVYLSRQFVGVGCGESIQIAKEMAARDVLRQLFHITDAMKPISFDLKLKSDSSEPFANISVKDWCEQNIEKLEIKSL